MLTEPRSEEGSSDAGSAPPASSRLDRVNHMLSMTWPDKGEVHAALHELSDEELKSFGLNVYRMNLLSLFGDTWGQERIYRTARHAMIGKLWGGWEYHHHYLPKLVHADDRPKLEGIPIRLIRDVLARGRGLVLAGFHQGPFRYFASDLAHAGIPICVPLAGDAYTDYVSARDANPDAELWRNFEFFNVEEPRGSLAVARTLARGGLVGVLIDGNNGMDGPKGMQRRMELDFLGCRARVKDGIVRMAARFGSPVLPFRCGIDGDRKVFTYSDLLDPGGPLKGSDADGFVDASMAKMYGDFTQSLLTEADEWSGGDWFHLWRVPPAPKQLDRSKVKEQLDRRLKKGANIRLNSLRLTELLQEPSLVWVDVRTNQCLTVPSDLVRLAEKLQPESGGVSYEWLSQQEDLDLDRAIRFLTQLAFQEALVVSEAEKKPHDAQG